MKNIARLTLFCMLLLGIHAGGLAQTNAPVRTTEVNLGVSGIRTFQNPRLLIKRVKENTSLRFSLFLDGGTAVTPSIYEFPCDRDVSRFGSLTLEPGMGFEKRLVLKKKLTFFYGGEARPRLRIVNSRVRYTNNCNSANTALRDWHSQNLDIGLEIYPFLGIKADLTDRLSFSVESGPSLNFVRSRQFQAHLSTSETNGQQTIERDERRGSRNNDLSFTLFKTPFFSFGYSF